METAYLVLSDGRCFSGRPFGARRKGVGELVFNTGMASYLETLTDPSCTGQIVVQTFPMIGNYGFIREDVSGACTVAGYVVRELCDTPSNFRSQGDLEGFLRRQGVPGICGVDTRELTRILRDEGTMNAMICSSVPDDIAALREHTERNAVARFSRKKISVHPAEGQERHAVTMVDYGVRGSMLRCLQKRGCTVTVVPHDTTAEAILDTKPDGIMLSDGPGNPEDCVQEVEQLSRLIGRLPVFGIGLGHQLAALALGGKTVRLRYGHRGANQPVRELGGPRTYITTQNHGYAVLSESLTGIGQELFVNANDGSCEGMIYPANRCLTVQFHPEISRGPQNMEFLFDRFVGMMGGNTHA